MAFLVSLELIRFVSSRAAHEEYQVVADSWRITGGNDKVFFTMVDYDEGHDVFNSVSEIATFVYLRN